MEGPSIHLIAEELQIFVNQKVKDCLGNSHFDKERLIGQKIKEIYAWGKRLVIQLEHDVIASHFLMYGSYRIDEERLDKPIRFAIITSKNAYYSYNCSVKCFPTTDIKKYIDFELDILSDVWNIKKVINLIRENPDSTIDDVLLDQNIFAGVGNIIKNEALFTSRLLPSAVVKNLTLKKIKELAINTRLFSLKFLELRKTFELKKNLEIYRKPLCPICGSKVVRQKTGKRNRWSFFCQKCQKIK